MTTASMPSSSAETKKPRLTRLWFGVREFLLHAVLQDRVIKRLYPGVMHFLLFWGVTIQILGTVISLMQYELFLPFTLPFPQGSAYLVFELTMDLAGVMILLGGLMAFFRRFIVRPKTLPNRWDDWYAIGLLFLIPILGFFSEGLRISISQPDWRAWAPIGNLISKIFSGLSLDSQTADAIHQTFFWSHVVSGLAFVASIPFTKLRHLVTGPLNIILRPQRDPAALEPIENIEEAEILGVGQVDEFSSILLLDFEACVQCGRCEEVCPSAASGMPYTPRSLVLDLRKQVQQTMVAANGGSPSALVGETLDKHTPWYCTTCGACLNVCPMFVNPVDTIVELRRYLTLTTGDIPSEVGEALMGMERRGNPWSMPLESHAPWAKELDVRVLQPGEATDVLLYVGCAFGYDSRSHQAGREIVKLLRAAEVNFAVLGLNESCCGETARRLGHEYLFQVMAEENIETFRSVQFNTIVTPCAHCFNTIKNEYPQFGGEFPVQHHSEFIASLLDAGRIPLKEAGLRGRFSYHDSCYLGRYNKIYDEPRRVLKSIPALSLSEIPRRRENGFCCGGGGGHMWMEIDPSTRINQKRLEEIIQQTAADTVVTACPYCLVMFEDAIRSKGIGETVRVLDLAEVLSESLGIQEPSHS